MEADGVPATSSGFPSFFRLSGVTGANAPSTPASVPAPLRGFSLGTSLWMATPFVNQAITNPLGEQSVVFSGAILLYADVLALTRDVGMLQRRHAVKMADPRAYALKVAKVLAIVALSPALTGLTVLFSAMAAVVAFVVSFVACIWLGVKVTG